MDMMANSEMHEPNVDECRTSRRSSPVISAIYECLGNGMQCKFAFSFGSGLFCQHPRRDDFCCQKKTRHFAQSH